MDVIAIRPPDADCAVVLNGGNQFSNGCSKNRMAQAWREFGQGHENKAPLVHARMRDFHFRCADHTGSIKQNIKIDDARAALADCRMTHRQK